MYFGNRSEAEKVGMMISLGLTRRRAVSCLRCLVHHGRLPPRFRPAATLYHHIRHRSATGLRAPLWKDLRLEECKMLGITDYFATITEDGKPGAR